MFIILNDMVLYGRYERAYAAIHTQFEWKTFLKKPSQTTRLGRIITNNVLEENIHNSLSGNDIWNETTIHVIRLGLVMFRVIKSEIVFFIFLSKNNKSTCLFFSRTTKTFSVQTKTTAPPLRTLDVYDIVNYYYDYDCTSN